MKWISAVLSVVIVGAFAGFYFYNYAGKKSYLKERDRRLVASGARALLDAAQADQPKSRVDVQGATLEVSGLATAGGGYTVPLAGVLARVARPESFAALAVTDATGAVLAQHPRVRIDGLGRIAPADTAGQGDKGPPVTAEVEAFTQRPTTRTLRFGEAELLAFCHPAPLPAPAAPEGARAAAAGPTLVVCGLVDQARLDREAGSVSPLMVALLLAILVLTLLVPPFLKVQLLTRPERLRFSDAFALAVCQFLGLMIAATAVFGLAVYFGLTSLADAELHDVARALDRHLMDELRRIEAQMQRGEAMLRGVHAADLAQVPGTLAGTGRSEVLARGLCRGDADPTCGPWPAVLPDYPYFESLAWISGDGRQRVKWWTGAGDAFFDVSRRSYFTDVREGRALPARPDAGPSGPYALASVRAWSSGDVRVVVARPSRFAWPSAATGSVQALATRLVSLSDPVLPAGVGFVLVDGRGDVVVHSDAPLSQTHNFFEETAHHPRLRAAVTGRAEDTFSARYWGRRYGLHVEPLSPLPWTLAVFREHEWLRAVGVEALSEALLLCLAFTFALFLLPAFVYVAVAGRRTPFPWPSPDLAWLYTHLAFTFVIIGALYLAGLARARGEDALALALVLPAAALLAAALVLTGRAVVRRRWPDGVSAHLARGARVAAMVFAATLVVGVSWFARSPWGLLLGSVAAALLGLALIEGSDRLRDAGWFRIPHRLASTGFWLLFAILPAAGFVKGATERALEAGASRSLALFAERLDQRARAVRGLYGDGVPAAATLREQRLAEEWDIYTGSLYGLRIETLAAGECRLSVAPPAAPSGWLGRRLSALKPYLAEHAVALRHGRAPRDAAGRPVTRWTVCTAGDPLRGVSGAPPTLAAVVGPWPWAGLAGLALLTWAVVRWSESALFATHVAPLATRTVGSVKSGLPDGAHLVLVVPSGFERRELLDGSWYDAWPDAPPTAPARGRPLLATEEQLLDADEARRRARAEVVEACVRHGARTVIVVASRPPSAWLADGGTLGAAERVRWARWLECFDVAVARSAAPRAEEIELHVDAWLGAAGSRRARKRALVAAEVGASPHVFALCAARIQPGELAERDPQASLRRIEEAAGGYYRSLWEACSADERLTLAQVADEGFVNPRRFDTLELLLAKGVVRLRPVLELMNESFEDFVRRPENGAPLEAAETRGTSFGWAHLRAPFVALGVAAGVFIFVTERSVFDSAAGLSALVLGSVMPLLGQVARAVQSLSRVAHTTRGGGSAHA